MKLKRPPVRDLDPDVRIVGYATLAFLVFMAGLVLAAIRGQWGRCAPLLGRAACAWLFGGQ